MFDVRSCGRGVREDLKACGDATRVTTRRLERYSPSLEFALVDVTSTASSRGGADDVVSCLPLDYENPSLEFRGRLAVADAENKESGLDLSRTIAQLLSETVQGARARSLRVHLAVSSAVLRDPRTTL